MNAPNIVSRFFKFIGRTKNQRLKRININICKVQNDSEQYELAESLSLNHNLVHISLSVMKLNHFFLEKFGYYINKFPKLKVLDLSYNDFND